MVENVDLNSLRKEVRTQQARAAVGGSETDSLTQPLTDGKSGRGAKIALLVGAVLIASTTTAVVAWRAGSNSGRSGGTQTTDVSESIPQSRVSPSELLPTITRLSDSNEVLVAQQLVNLFVSPVTVDGKWGPQTDDGISRLRSELGLDDGALIDASVWRAAFSKLKIEADTEGLLRRPRRSLASISVPSSSVLIEVEDSSDSQTKWTYYVPEGVDLLKIQLAMSELNPEKTLGGWKFCRSEILESQSGLRRSWWAYPERLLNFTVEDRDGLVAVVVSKQGSAPLAGCRGFKGKG